MISSRPQLFAVAAVCALLPAVAACSSDPSSPSTSASATAISVNATDTACELSSSAVASGSTSFSVSNKGSQVTEVYIYGKNGDAFTTIVTEVENIGPGTSRDMSADLGAGTYEVACKPGQTGNGIRSTLTVTDPGGSASATSDRPGNY